MPNNRTYRIKADIQGEDYVNVGLNLNQDVNVFEFLSLKIDTENFYRLHTANYGCVAGRVLANNAIGVPNVKISIFIEADTSISADSVLSYLYPYDDVMDKNRDGVRYNLLPEDQLFLCHQNVGTFPSKRMVLDDSNVFEVFDKYYKFTTTTNNAGDYMIFGVPVGTQILHMDVDLSDIGDLLSQKPRDFIYKGYNVNQFENANMFKKDKNLNTLTQLFTQNESVNVHPFWGEVDEMGEADSTGVRITRKDINLNYKFEPTCVFMGSLITDEKSNGFTKRCIPTERMGKMDRITTGEGTIEMIRKTPDGSVEEYTIMGNQLIDGNGTWCYQIPMNLDYVRTDEYGNIVPTNDIEKGLPTRAKVRFRFSLNDFASDYQNNHLTKMLVPNNPQTLDDMDYTYAFGTRTPENEFRDLFWNKVYSVKSYIPRVQKSNTNREKRFSGIKAVNVNVGNNPIPYNNMRIDITFMFTLQCAIMHMLIWIAGAFNALIAMLLTLPGCGCGVGKKIANRFTNGTGACLTVGDGACPDLEGWYFAPRCKNKGLNEGKNPLKLTLNFIKDKEGLDDEEKRSVFDVKSAERENSEEESVCITNVIDYFLQCIEIALAQEYEVIQFDFYNDWINGLLYIPRWFANIKKKRKYLFGLLGPRKAKTQACMEDTVRYQRRYVQQCAIEYEKENGVYKKISSKRGCVSDDRQKCYKAKGRKNVKILKNTKPGRGFIHNEQTLKGEYAYYFRPCDWYNGERKKINYFATDIILLGSLSIHDIDGIPQTFKELSSSSYQMPTNLAATNMDTVAYMYGTAASGGALCSGKSIQTIKRNDNTFQDYEKWAKRADYSDDIENDSAEYEVTEASGIDWGYTGPGQDYKKANSKIADFASDFYQPGGHFLGIACFNAESNIKSCVNLSRICEMGAMMSQRQAIARKNSNNTEVTFASSFLVPTGFISKDEISDSGFRSEFATLNHNGLATRINPLTNRVEYDFISMLPSNFDGSLKSKLSSTAYNNLNGVKEPSTVRTGSQFSLATAYTRTIEENSVDYYDFRLGIGNRDYIDNKRNIDDKYLIVDSNKASLPMYNNSYYFYFGLRDGSTALDRFYKEFFAQCPDFHDEIVTIKIISDNIDACGEPNTGHAKIYIGGISTDNEIKWSLNRNGSYITGGTYNTNESYMELSGLYEGNYDITFTCDDFEDITKTFSIVRGAPSFASNIEVSVKDFTKTKYTDDRTDTDGRGSVTASWDDNRIDSVEIRSNDNPSHTGTLQRGVEFYLWSDEEYSLVMKYRCGNVQREYVFYTFTPSMPKEFDLIIGGSREVTFNRMIKGRLSYSDWWESVFSNGSLIEKYYTELAITYRQSIFEKNESTIDVRPAYGDTPYVITQDGNGEMLGEENSWLSTDLYLSNGEEEGYDLNYTSFLFPTFNEPPEGVGSYRLFDSAGSPLPGKENYRVRFADANGDGVKIPSDLGDLTLPSIYKPFFIRCAIVKFSTNSGLLTYRYSLTAVNGTLYDDTFSEINVCSQHNSEVRRASQGEWWNITGGTVNDFIVHKQDGTLSIADIINYDIRVACKSPESNDDGQVVKEISERVRFVGDGGIPDSSVRYFLMCRENAYGNRSEGTGTSYYIEVRDKIADKLTFSDGTHLKEGQADGNIYWKGSCTNAFEIILADGGYLRFKPSNELDIDKILAGDTSEISEANKKPDCFVIGVYDPWTQLTDEEFAIAQNTQNGNDIKWHYTGRDSDIVAIFRIYAANEFAERVKNPDIHDGGESGGGDTGDTPQYDFIINTDEFERYINMNVNSSRLLAMFNIDSHSQTVVVNPLEVVLIPPQNGSMYAQLSAYIYNMQNPGDREYIYIEGGPTYIGTIDTHTRLLTSEKTIPADDLSTGTWAMYMDYIIEPMNQEFGMEGSLRIGSTTINVTTL